MTTLSTRERLSIVVTLACFTALGHAQTTNSTPTTPPGVGDLSIEELVNLHVTSVSKKEQRLADAPAAIFVLENEDIRRSGATTDLKRCAWLRIWEPTGN